ncbi:MAG: DegQ family serine endoprotease [Pseudohongiellaceae bacterium]
MRLALRSCSMLLVSSIVLADSASVLAQQQRPGVADMLEQVTPAVVNISVQGHQDLPQNPLLNDPFFRRFFEIPEGQQQPQQRETQSVGSGVIIDSAEGYILTNHHVVNDADAIKVTLQDRREIVAKLIGSDEGTDIALLQIEADDLSALPLSDSDTLRVGDQVLAIGNPFGLGQTVTTGMISALGRSGLNRESYEDFIQTDASINPGNSGGALVDYNGELIGINSAIIAPSGGNVGIGFAVPINMAMAVVDQLVEFGDIKRGMLGVSIGDVTPDLADALELDVTEGAVVQSVTPDSSAAKAGLQAGDIIVAVDGAAVRDGTALRNRIGLMRAGTELEVTYLREGQRRNVRATISERSEQAVASVQGASDTLLEGVELSGIPSDHPQSGRVEGALVTRIGQNSRAFAFGLRANDIITAVNRRPARAPEEVESLIAAARGAVALNINRDGQELFLIMR